MLSQFIQERAPPLTGAPAVRRPNLTTRKADTCTSIFTKANVLSAAGRRERHRIRLRRCAPTARRSQPAACVLSRRRRGARGNSRMDARWPPLSATPFRRWRSPRPSTSVPAPNQMRGDVRVRIGRRGTTLRELCSDSAPRAATQGDAARCGGRGGSCRGGRQVPDGARRSQSGTRRNKRRGRRYRDCCRPP